MKPEDRITETTRIDKVDNPDKPNKPSTTESHTVNGMTRAVLILTALTIAAGSCKKGEIITPIKADSDKAEMAPSSGPDPDQDWGVPLEKARKEKDRKTLEELENSGGTYENHFEALKKASLEQTKLEILNKLLLAHPEPRNDPDRLWDIAIAANLARATRFLAKVTWANEAVRTSPFDPGGHRGDTLEDALNILAERQGADEEKARKEWEKRMDPEAGWVEAGEEEAVFAPE